MGGLFSLPQDLPAAWALEHEALEAGHRFVAGVDEVGRGPLAGPVVAAAVILPLGLRVEGIRDSKTMSPLERETASRRIWAEAVSVAWGAAGAGEIDRLNILRASLLAMERAVKALSPAADFLLIDGLHALRLDLPQRAVVKGETRSVSVAAASIVAKVVRDRMMVLLDRVFPGYGFAGHKGYPTRPHRAALNARGPCFAHRRTFRGVRELVS